MCLVGHVENSIRDILDLIKYIVKINITYCFFFNLANGELQITPVAHIISPLDTEDLHNSLSSPSDAQVTGGSGSSHFFAPH